MLTKISVRAVFAAMAIISIALLVTAYELQYGPQQQQPCPFCVLQRYAYIGIALISFLGAIHGPDRLGTALYATANAVCSLAGILFASWQLTKVGAAESCLADPVAEFVNTLSSANWWPEYLFATGGCGAKLPPILGLSVPVWSLIWFVAFAVLSVFLCATPWRRSR